MTDEELAQGRLYPPLSNIREVSIYIAVKVSVKRESFLQVFTEKCAKSVLCGYYCTVEPLNTRCFGHNKKTAQAFVHFIGNTSYSWVCWMLQFGSGDGPKLGSSIPETKFSDP